jgi:Zn-dependent protease/predicted transcriptional regulator
MRKATVRKLKWISGVQTHVKLGRIFGVDIGFHYSWIVIAVLITLSLVGQFTEAHPEWASRVVWISAIITGILFFASIVVHELSHVLVARARGVPVKGITLFALGGVAQIEKDSADAKTEFFMGLVGPATSFAIGIICVAIAGVSGASSPVTPRSPPLAIIGWLGYINIVLAAFNMIPGFPLDGGRVLRGLVWWVTKDQRRATRVATWVGRAVAYIFIGYGIFTLFAGSGLGAIWLALIGWFLLEANRAQAQREWINEELRGIRVKDVMSERCQIIDERESLKDFVEDAVLKTGRRCFVVKHDGRVAGLITPADVKDVPKERWPDMKVEDVMKPLDQVKAVDPDSEVIDALEEMGREGVNQLPVVTPTGDLEGVISRSDLIHVLQARSELHM